MSKPTLLIVDDDPTIRTFIKELLTAEVYILEAKDGLEGVQILLSRKVDLLFTDLQMPRMNGLELISFVRNHPQIHDLPICMCTSLQDQYTRNKALCQGVRFFLGKPIVIHKLHRVVETLLGSL